MYIEMLAGTGLLGGAALAYFTWRVGATALRALGSIRRRRGEWPEDAVGRSLLVSGVAAGVTAIAVHGLVDSFLSFTATYVLIAVALGLLASLEFLSRPHADRL
jgi:O-antigen ligase